MSFITDALFGSDEQQSTNQTVTQQLSPAQSAALQGQADLITRMLGREESLWPQIMQLMSMIQPSAEAARTAATAPVDAAYPNVTTALNNASNLQLPDNAKSTLQNLRDERISGLRTGVDDLLGKSVADLARRGMMSSSTAEGSMGNIAKSIEPYVSAANQDYYNSLLTMPFQLANTAVTGLNAATNYGAVKSGAEQGYLSTMLQPWIGLWNSAFSGGMSPVGNMGKNETSTGTKSPATPGILPMAGAMWGMNGFKGLGGALSGIGNGISGLFGGGSGAGTASILSNLGDFGSAAGASGGADMLAELPMMFA